MAAPVKAPASKMALHNTKLGKYLEFYQRMIAIRDEFPDNADFNERVNTRIAQIADTLTLAIREGFKIIIKLRNGTEIIPKSIGGYYDFHFLTYIDESDDEGTEWRDFDLEKVVSFLVEERPPIESVIGVDPSTLPMATKVQPLVHEYNLPIGIVDTTGEEDEDYNPWLTNGNGNGGYVVTYNDDGTFDVAVPEQPTRRDDEDGTCTCADCQRDRARTARTAVAEPIENEQVIQQALQRVFRNTYANDDAFGNLLETIQAYQTNH